MDDGAPDQAGRPGPTTHRAGRRRERALALAVLSALFAVPLVHAWAQAGAVRARANLSLTDDTGGVALFPGTSPLSPGARQTSCLVVSAGGAAPGDTVTFAAESVSGPLASWVQVEVEAGTGGGQGSCAGFSGSLIFTGTLDDLGNVPGDGVSTGWSPSAVGSRSFRLTVDVPNDPAALGLTATASFTWRLVAVASPPGPPDPTPTASPTGSPTDSPTPTAPSSPTTTAPLTGEPTTDPVAPTTAPTTVPAPAPPPEPTTEPTTEPAAAPTTDQPPTGGPTTGPAVPTPAPTTAPSPEVAVLATGKAGTVDLWSNQHGPSRTPKARTAKTAPPTADLILRASVPRQVTRTLVSVVRDPAPLLWSACVAVLFLLLQHRLDLRDPKLTAAWRTGRDLTLRFPSSYQAEVPGTGPAPDPEGSR